MDNLKFFYNGIKENGGKLQPVSYSDGGLIGHPAGTLTIYARSYSDFSRGVYEAFRVQNDTDIMTDYFEHSRIRVEPNHPLYSQVLAACNAAKAKQAARHVKRMAKIEQRQAA